MTINDFKIPKNNILEKKPRSEEEIENYLYPMIDNGFKVEKISQTREHSNLIICRRQ